MISIVDKSKGWFGIENKFVDDIMKLIKPVPTCIYIALKRFAGSRDACFPNQDTIAEKIGTTRATVNRNIKVLVEMGLIQIEESVAKKGKKYTYILLPLSKIVTGVSNNKLHGVVTNSYTKNKQYKNIDISKDISTVSTVEKEYNFEEKLYWLLESNNEVSNIIGYYWKTQGIQFPSQKTYNAGYKRELRSAKLLQDYTTQEIVATVKYLKTQNFDKWTLETVLKYICNLKKLRKK